jgi:hypothetical protein
MSTKPQSLLTDSPFQVRIWQPGYTYLPGDVVQPTTTTNSALSPPTNADFVASLTGWTAGTGYSWDGTKSYNSTGGAAKFAAGSASAQITNGNQVAVTVGQKITGQFYGMMATSDPNGAYVNVRFVWYDSGHTLLSTTDGQQIVINTLGGPVTWWQVTATGTAPAGAAFCAIAAVCDNSLSAQHIWIDAFYWDYMVPGAGAQNFFTDITTVSATSGTTEPDWTNGGTNTGNVTDGGITWARGQQTIIYWYTIPFCLSGTTEPTWHTNVGGATSDGGVPWLYGGNGKFFDWICHTPQVQDVNCPQNKYVALASSKIFSGDQDIVRFSATTNPMDWTSEADAGFLPTGLQTYGANPTTAMGLYRSNLVVFNSEGLQMWQLDEDPANMSLLTALPIGSIWHKALAPVNNDLFFLAAQGVRTMGITGGSGNAESGDVGMPIDQLVQLGVAYCSANSTEPLATYYPSAGQYWIHFPGWDSSAYFKAQTGAYAAHSPSITSTVFVYTMSRTGEVGAWSRYLYPFPTIDAFCQLNDVLYIRSGDDILQVDPTVLYDYASDTYLSGNRQTAFPGVVQWQWLDFGQPGITKQFDGIDVSSTQGTNLTVEIGYDQTSITTYTPSFTVPGDSYQGTVIPIPIMAPSCSVRLSMTSTDNWQIESVNVYLKDQRTTS